MRFMAENSKAKLNNRRLHLMYRHQVQQSDQLQLEYLLELIQLEMNSYSIEHGVFAAVRAGIIRAELRRRKLVV